ncbi:TIGR02453 family protein [Octadecabacter sp. G9-8]|uniref:TIGR02453 family protein n=1 Tax=Octadecabacter dasysiphoniae TaxID=2909341 RepID=A0ABS9CS78_9RHOB|nr:TIGR02453 family protein [Octadecabacter dasysiphoniae]MCF2870085.1 TIGR02453 family protein [Octadecabacter dasysiphoniae]
MFDTLIKDAQTFLRALAQDNTRDWFLDHKSEYDAKLRDPAKALLDELAPHLSRVTGYPVTTKLFRAHRDVRFSKDKTPYNTHLHMMWGVQTGTRQDPALFFGINPSQVTVATGMMEFSKDVLGDWRKVVDLDGAYVSDKIETAAQHGYAPWEPKLKRVPPPFGKDHPMANCCVTKDWSSRATRILQAIWWVLYEKNLPRSGPCPTCWSASRKPPHCRIRLRRAGAKILRILAGP